MKKIILDCDGVLLNWIDSFNSWLFDIGFITDPSVWDSSNYDIPIEDQDLAKKLITAFNQTYHVSRLTPIPGAVKAISALHQAGCQLNVITAFSDRYEAMKMREQNLIAVFGDVFNEIVSLPVGYSKKDWLAKQDPQSYYIEDVVKHLKEGLAAGLHPDKLILVPQDYNYNDWEKFTIKKTPLDNFESHLDRMKWHEITYTFDTR